MEARLETEVDRGARVESAEQVARVELTGVKTSGAEDHHSRADDHYSRADETEDPHGGAEHHHN